MDRRDLPDTEEILFAMSEAPLGMGEEATVYKIHTNPDYTVRVSNDAPSLKELFKLLPEKPFIEQEDIFDGRNYAQAVAYWGLDELDNTKAMITLNLYQPGISMEIHKPGREMPSSEDALNKTIVLSKAVLDMPDSAIDKIYDDLHFLSSREYSIDVGNGGLFTNTGNILYSKKDSEFRIIDIQPFVRDRVGIPPHHKKGFNTPLFLTRGLVPGALGYAKEHAEDKQLIEYRTEIVHNIIAGAKRNHLNDEGGYLRGDLSAMTKFWQLQLMKLNIPEKYQDIFIREVCSVEQKNRYQLVKSKLPIIRVAGRSFNS